MTDSGFGQAVLERLGRRLPQARHVASVTLVTSMQDHRQALVRCHGHAARAIRADGHAGGSGGLPMIGQHDLWSPRQVPYRVLAGRGS